MTDSTATTVNCTPQAVSLQQRTDDGSWVNTGCQISSNGRVSCNYQPRTEYRLVNFQGQPVSGVYISPPDPNDIPNIVHFRMDGTVGLEACSASTINFTVYNCSSLGLDQFLFNPDSTTTDVPGNVAGNGSASTSLTLSGNASDGYSYFLAASDGTTNMTYSISIDGTGTITPSELFPEPNPAPNISGQTVYIWDPSITSAGFGITNIILGTAANTAWATTGCLSGANFVINNCANAELTVMVNYFPSSSSNTDFVPLPDESGDPITVPAATSAGPGSVTIGGMIGGMQLQLAGNLEGAAFNTSIYSIPPTDIPASVTFPVSGTPGPNVTCTTQMLSATVGNCIQPEVESTMQVVASADSSFSNLQCLGPISSGSTATEMDLTEDSYVQLRQTCSQMTDNITQSFQVTSDLSGTQYFRQDGTVGSSCYGQVSVNLFNCCPTETAQITYCYPQGGVCNFLALNYEQILPLTQKTIMVPAGASISASLGDNTGSNRVSVGTDTTQTLSFNIHPNLGGDGPTMDTSACVTPLTVAVNNCYESDMTILVGNQQQGTVSGATSSGPGQASISFMSGQTFSLGNPNSLTDSAQPGEMDNLIFFQDGTASSTATACQNTPQAVNLTVHNCYSTNLTLCLDGDSTGTVVPTGGEVNTGQAFVGQLVQLTGSGITSGHYNLTNNSSQEIWFPSDGSPAGTSGTCGVSTITITVNNCYGDDLTLNVNGVTTSTDVAAGGSTIVQQQAGDALLLQSSSITSGSYTVASGDTAVFFRSDMIVASVAAVAVMLPTFIA